MSINRNKTLEDRIRNLERKVKKMQEILNEFREMNKRFDRLESRFDRLEKKVDDGFNKTGKSFLTLAYPLENQCGDPGAKASNELKEIWKDDE